ncbi:MAG TPA: DUF885 domain-containing protein [Thermoanaerobaculia bacterium]|nr:DUF885 domain-containing protein [Thermoanaerobaculia bacterium]
MRIQGRSGARRRPRLFVPLLVVLTVGARNALAADPALVEIAARIRDFASFRGTPSRRLAELFDLSWHARMREMPEIASALGYGGVDDRLPDLSSEGLALGHRLSHFELAALDSIDRAQLTPDERLSFDLARRRFLLEIEGERFGSRDPWHNDWMLVDRMVDRIGGALELVSSTPARTVADYEAALARLRGFPRLADDGIARLKDGLKRGITPPRITLRDLPGSVDALLPSDPDRSPVLEPFRRIPGSIPSSERERLKNAADAAFTGEVAPALRRYRDFLVREYLPGARESLAMSAMPGGAAWYAWLLRYYTTTDLSPAEIHRIGLSEVARIRREMDGVIAAASFPGDFRRFAEFLRTDPRFFYRRPEDLVDGYRVIAKRIDPELVRLFRRLPRLPYGVRAMDEAQGKTAPSAYYDNGSSAAGRPGWLLVNTASLDSRPKWEMEALTLHEAVPGHHLAYAVAEELGNLPEWRKWDVYPAYSEGWALYAEGLGEEIGIYRDAYSRFGRLNLEIWRAIRLVVDTGIQTLNWSRQQAIDYCRENSARSDHDIEQEVDRYIVQPGSAPAYKIGERKILELRSLAERELGTAFDVRDFHEAVLGGGQLPLDLLERRVDDWIADRKAAGGPGRPP